MQQDFLKENEVIEPLADGALYILQNGALPRFSLDACLLAAFCSVRAGEKGADFCSGTGIIPLLLHLREPQLKITAIELLPELADMASRSFGLNSLDNIKMLQADIKEAPAIFGEEFDFITCNPPYYPLDKSRLSEDIFKAAARNELYCTLSDCIANAAAVLKNGGRLALCIVFERAEEAKKSLQENGLALRRIVEVRDSDKAEPWLMLLEAAKAAESDEIAIEKLVVHNENRQYTQQMLDFCSAWLKK
ncbi:MAG: methyltransferase [Firmicutes bacterium]|nr:methyltransferase [Bacillota bacterium]